MFFFLAFHKNQTTLSLVQHSSKFKQLDNYVLEHFYIGVEPNSYGQIVKTIVMQAENPDNNWTTMEQLHSRHKTSENQWINNFN